MITKIRNCVRLIALYFLRWLLVYGYGMDIAASARVSWGTKLDKTYPKGIHIGAESYCASDCLILTHDYARGIHTDTHIGRRCFIGANAIVMPGVSIGDCVIVGAGAIVTKSVPSGCIVVGNPAKVIREGIKTARFGKLIDGQNHLLCDSPLPVSNKIGDTATS